MSAPTTAPPKEPEPAIAPLFHFIWYGKQFPDFAVIAIASALAKNPGCRAILWHETSLDPSQALSALSERGLEQRVIDCNELIGSCRDRNPPFDPDELRLIYQELRAPAARANVLRLLLLFAHGGVYLDTDTLTLKELTSLRGLAGFCGLEHVLWPTGRPKTHPGALALDALRWICGQLPQGAKINDRMLRFYSQAANNAVLGFSDHHPLCGEILKAATRVPRTEWTKRYRLGTHLLQEVLTQAPPKDSRFECLPPVYFYPQGPVMSHHYFRYTPDVERTIAELLSERTHVIHWYASVSELSSRNATHIERRQNREVYARLCAPYLELFSTS